jgi:predicted alpha/beta-fold hydrolase
VNDLWRCIGTPDARHAESGFHSTMRMVYGDVLQRMRNQRSATACEKSQRPRFRRIDLPSSDGRAPLHAYFHEGAADRPVVIVVHGLYDSNADRYLRIVGAALADESYGVLVPDMRWHGCLLSRDWLSTLGIEEAKDLSAWSRQLQQLPGAASRPVGLLGFSLGALDVIAALSQPEAVTDFRAGGIAVSPPAGLSVIVRRLDERPSIFRDHRSAFFLLGFRSFLRTRLRELGPQPGPQPFQQYIEFLRNHWPSADAPATAGALLADAEPATRLSRVQVPLLIITSMSDPILGDVPARELAAAAHPDNVQVTATADGGHVGQLGRYPEWMSDLFARFFVFAPRIGQTP